MPCTLEPWEIEVEEKNANQRKYGLDMNDGRVATAVACAAFKVLAAKGLEKLTPDWAQRWWKQHKKEDRKRETGG